MSATLTPSRALSQFDEQGYVLLHGFLEPHVVQAVRRECEHLVEREAQRLLAEGKISHTFAEESFETRLAKLFDGRLDDAPRRWREDLHLPGFFDLFFHPRLLDVVEAFLGPQIRLYPNYTVRPKLPEWAGHQVLWHQDGGYTGGEYDRLRMVNVWTPLVPVSVENGCMQFVPGSYKLGPLPHEPREHYLEIAADVLEPLLPRAVNIEIDPGDVVLFSNMLLHQGLPNHSTMVRWSVDWRYQDATQTTMRGRRGHLARSREHPEQAVQTPEQWASLRLE